MTSPGGRLPASQKQSTHPASPSPTTLGGTIATRDNGVEVTTYTDDDAGRIASLTTPTDSIAYLYTGAGDLAPQ